MTFLPAMFRFSLAPAPLALLVCLALASCTRSAPSSSSSRATGSDQSHGAAVPQEAPPPLGAARRQESAAEEAVAPSTRFQAPLPEQPRRRAGLGTHWGERRDSQVHEVRFSRQAARQPFAMVTFHYDDGEGVQFSTGRGEAQAYPGIVPVQGGALEVSLVESDEDPLPLIAAQGRYYVIGDEGERYAIRVRNHTPGRFEIVASVDGLDVLTGTDASLGQRGYVVEPWGTLRIEGFRESDHSIRSFRFGENKESYAVRRGKGRNVGVVGVALFEERGFRFGYDDNEAFRRANAQPFPGKYALPPPY